MYFLIPEFLANAYDTVRMSYLGKSKLTYIDSYGSNTFSNIANDVTTLQYETTETVFVPENDTLGIANDQDPEIVFNPEFTDTYMFNYTSEVK
jgi:hypothetical protein